MMYIYNDPERPTEPKEYTLPHCPVCGEECEDLYRNTFGEIVGCDCCLDKIDAYEWENTIEEHWKEMMRCE